MRIIIIPYRDAYFWNLFGTSVRDLQIIEVLSRKFDVTVVNRPVSLYERIINKSNKKATYKIENRNIRFIDTTSFDLIGPLKGRSWTEYCYTSLVKNILIEEEKKGEKYIVLDFSPFWDSSCISGFKNCIYWYDLIDNFSKHNRYSTKEKNIVINKYSKVGEISRIITGVSSDAIRMISCNNKKVLPNGVYDYISKKVEVKKTTNQIYDFGFVGFITNKLDVEFINKLASKYSVGLWGKVFDKEIIKHLNPKVSLHGQFKYDDISQICKSFKVGLIPYLKAKSHDESPLKMYEYFKYCKPCLASINYEIKSDYYINYNELDEKELDESIRFLIKSSNDIIIKEQINETWLLSHNVDLIMNEII